MFSLCDQTLQCPPQDMKWNSGMQVAPNCPRCASSNTKFCYYNNYSFSQPRYLCKGCRRYWTKGGSLRNVPVGGGCRKSRRGKSSTTTTTSINSNRNKITLNGICADGPGGGPDIDLALVFAKFLNHNSSSSSSNNSLNVECQEPIFQEPYPVQEIIPRVVEQQQEEKSSSFQESMGSDEFGLRNLSADEVVQMQDVLWSSGDATQGLEWEPMAQLQQQFEASLPVDDDQLKISTNFLMDENWSSFDLSGFGVNFPNP